MTDANKEHDPDKAVESPPTDEPYPWRASDPETDSDPRTDSETPPTDGERESRADHQSEQHPSHTPVSDRGSNNSPVETQPPSPSRELSEGTPQKNQLSSESWTDGEQIADSEVREDSQRIPSEGSPVLSEPDQKDVERSITAKILLFVIDSLSRLWHAKILGFHWLLPRITGTTDPHEGISGRFYPSEMIRGDEEVVYSGNPSRWVNPGPYVLGAALIVLAVVISIMVPLGLGGLLLDMVTPEALDLSVPDRWWYAPLLFLAAAGLLLGKAALSRGSTWHVLTNKRLLYRKNILTPTTKRIDLVDVNSIDGRQPLPERWYDVGYIDIYTASTGGIEVTLDGVKDPTSVSKLIDKVRYQYQQKVRGGYPGDGERMAGNQQHPGNQPGTSQPPGGHTNDRRPPSDSEGVHRPHSPHDRKDETLQSDSRRAPFRGQRDPGPSGDNSGNRFSERAHTDVQHDGPIHGEEDPLADNGGDSIEEQRPNHSLRDEIEGLSDRDYRDD